MGLHFQKSTAVQGRCLSYAIAVEEVPELTVYGSYSFRPCFSEAGVFAYGTENEAEISCAMFKGVRSVRLV
jgi:hypothetical protein